MWEFIDSERNFFGVSLHKSHRFTMKMIEFHYNHPSIIIWGILNECASETEEGREMYKKLHVYAGAEHAQAAQKPEVLTF